MRLSRRSKERHVGRRGRHVQRFRQGLRDQTNCTSTTQHLMRFFHVVANVKKTLQKLGFGNQVVD